MTDVFSHSSGGRECEIRVPTGGLSPWPADGRSPPWPHRGVPVCVSMSGLCFLQEHRIGWGPPHDLIMP